jgi:hypothetical protein
MVLSFHGSVTPLQGNDDHSGERGYFDDHARRFQRHTEHSSIRWKCVLSKWATMKYPFPAAIQDLLEERLECGGYATEDEVLLRSVRSLRPLAGGLNDKNMPGQENDIFLSFHISVIPLLGIEPTVAFEFKSFSERLLWSKRSRPRAEFYGKSARTDDQRTVRTSRGFAAASAVARIVTNWRSAPIWRGLASHVPLCCFAVPIEDAPSQVYRILQRVVPAARQVPVSRHTPFGVKQSIPAFTGYSRLRICPRFGGVPKTLGIPAVYARTWLLPKMSIAA